MKNRVHAARRVGFLFPLIVFLAPVPVALATVVEYAGQVTHQGEPVENAFVIAGTLGPDLNAVRYVCFYGDASCNMLSSHYAQAVADGNFRPIGDGTHTSASGSFNGSGSASDISGLPIYLFVLSDQDRPGPSDPDLARLFALASSTDPSWIAGDINIIDGQDANVFVLGSRNGTAIEVLSGPVPEPASGVLMISGILLALPMFRRRRFRGCATKA